MPELFSKSKLMGTFKGFSEKGFEFAAEIVAPYNTEMQDRPQLGQFLLIQLSTPEEASLGRITKFVPSGLLASAEGEDYVNTMQEREQEVPEDLKKSKLKYRVQIKLLGAVKNVQDGSISKIVFVPSQRRLPHLGAKVALPSDDVLKELCQLSGGNTDLGDYVLGEFVYSGITSQVENVMRHIQPELKVTFNINNLVSKRSVVFARAGYGKSNLMKYLTSELYRQGFPTTKAEKKVGVLIFDADGEYFWPNPTNKRPGFCDVPHLQEKMVVFTNRAPINQYYGSWKYGEVKIDVRELPARDVISLAVSSERQDNQNVLKLKALNDVNWRGLVDLIYTDGLSADEGRVGELLGYNTAQIASAMSEINAAKSNVSNVIRLLHDPTSKLLAGTLEALKNGYVVVVDISMLSSTAGNNIAGLLMRKIFSFNQEHFTGEASMPVIVVIEEAQSVLGKKLEESSPFVEWVKEGRKYDLGAILITQQPGSMAPEIMSQADNWFSFHLLSEGDASTLGKYNSHYSHDVLAHIIGEPIVGNCYMWSAPLQPFVLPVRIRNFDDSYINLIKLNKSEPVFPNAPVTYLRKKINDKISQLAGFLIDEMRASKLNIFISEDKEVKGIYSGQLFKIIEGILSRDIDDTTVLSPNQLKAPLLARALNVDIGEIFIAKNGGNDYYCAKTNYWNSVFS